ncbi:MAG: MFS transporter [Gammaproteobacteria bacterium]|nr:MFS transporter [Gammaproteobacteria bacterium]
MSGNQSVGIKFGPWWLSPGILRRHVVVMFMVNWISMMLVPFINFIQPLVFQGLEVPPDQQGTLTANLGLLSDVIALGVMVIIGAVSDRTGRRVIVMVGFLLLIVGLGLYPRAEGIAQLYLFRGIVGLGMGVISTAMLTVIQDYPQDRSRGKYTGMNSVFSGLGVMVMAVGIMRLPEMFVEGGATQNAAVINTFLVCVGIGIFAALLARFGLSGALPDPDHRTESVFGGVSDAIAEARKNPRLLLSFIAAFAARGDLAVAGTYFALWFMYIGTAQGIDSTEVATISGQYFGLLNLAIMVWAPIYGVIIDRVNRVTAVTLGLATASAGYFLMGSIDNPFNPAIIIPACILLGMGETSAVVSCGSLVGQEAPPRIRGSVIGFYALCGSFGILSLSFISGLIFDAFSPNAPFIFMGAVNLVIVVIALYVRVRYGNPTNAAATS